MPEDFESFLIIYMLLKTSLLLLDRKCQMNFFLFFLLAKDCSQTVLEPKKVSLKVDLFTKIKKQQEFVTI